MPLAGNNKNSYYSPRTGHVHTPANDGMSQSKSRLTYLDDTIKSYPCFPDDWSVVTGVAVIKDLIEAVPGLIFNGVKISKRSEVDGLQLSFSHFDEQVGTTNNIESSWIQFGEAFENAHTMFKDRSASLAYMRSSWLESVKLAVGYKPPQT